MMLSTWRLGFICWILTVSILIGIDGALGSEEAYVTLLYGDEFLLGIRVLGKSIRDSGSTKDMVALVSDGVSDYTKQLLQVFVSELDYAILFLGDLEEGLCLLYDRVFFFQFVIA